ncbi:MAG: hypothetical protein AAFX04_10700 [Pseudomonadota bacterium]
MSADIPMTTSGLPPMIAVESSLPVQVDIAAGQTASDPPFLQQLDTQLQQMAQAAADGDTITRDDPAGSGKRSLRADIFNENGFFGTPVADGPASASRPSRPIAESEALRLSEMLHDSGLVAALRSSDMTAVRQVVARRPATLVSGTPAFPASRDSVSATLSLVQHPAQPSLVDLVISHDRQAIAQPAAATMPTISPALEISAAPVRSVDAAPESRDPASALRPETIARQAAVYATPQRGSLRIILRERGHGLELVADSTSLDETSQEALRSILRSLVAQQGLGNYDLWINGVHDSGRNTGFETSDSEGE